MRRSRNALGADAPQPEVIPPLDLHAAPPGKTGFPWLLILIIAGAAYWYFSSKAEPTKQESEESDDTVGETDDSELDDEMPEMKEFTLLKHKKRAT